MKKSILTILVLLVSSFVFAHSDSDGITTTVKSSGISLGAAIAVVISWSNNKSILWAIIHGVLSWLYVIYYALTRKDL